jgi:hypothetical protein
MDLFDGSKPCALATFLQNQKQLLTRCRAYIVRTDAEREELAELLLDLALTFECVRDDGIGLTEQDYELIDRARAAADRLGGDR